MTYRDLQKLGSLAGNNFFLFVFLLLGQSGGFLQVLLGLLLLFPFSSDPLRSIPSERLQQWPLTPRIAFALRLASVWFSPVAWITVGLIVWTKSFQFAATFVGISALFYALGSLFTWVPARAPRLNILSHVPDFGGSIGGLVRKNARELLSILDPYAGLVLTLSATAYRFLSSRPEPDAFMILSMLVALTLSTYALCLFGLDTASGFTRYLLFPIRGWQILLAKDVAFLTVLLILVAPLHLLAGLAAGLMALTVGHHSSVRYRVPQTHWRFTGGAPLTSGLLQAFLMFSAGTLVARTNAWVLLPCVALFAASLWYFGRDMDQAGLRSDA